MGKSTCGREEVHVVTCSEHTNAPWKYRACTYLKRAFGYHVLQELSDMEAPRKSSFIRAWCVTHSKEKQRVQVLRRILQDFDICVYTIAIL